MSKVYIMMSAYNGEKYISEQIDSILRQRGIEFKLFIRDDGSTDATVKIIQEYRKHDSRIILYQGENIGWKRSFLRLLSKIPDDADYYAFSDQDDIWLDDKIQRALKILKKMYGKRKCYCSAQTFVNENLEPFDFHIRKRFRYPDEYHCITNGYGMGCTLVFDKDLLLTLKEGSLLKIRNISHDLLVSVTAVYLGTIYRDQKSRILYRQHGSNAGSRSGHENLYERMNRVLHFDGFFVRETADYMLNYYQKQLTEKQKHILRQFADVGKWKNKIALIFNRSVSRDTLSGTLKVKAYILISR